MRIRWMTGAMAVLWGLTLWADDAEVVVRPASEALLEAVPNQNVTTLLFVQNRSGQSHEFIDEVELPQGWRLITREFPYELADGESESKLLSFFVPQGTPAGDYRVYFRVRSRKYPAVNGYFALPVHVREYRDYALEVWNIPKMVIAGDVIEGTVYVRNRSNLPDSLTLRCVPGPSWKSEVQPAAFRIEAGGIREVRIRIQTDARLAYTLNASIRLELASFTLKQTVATAAFSVSVIARIYGSDDPFYRFPIRASVAWVAQELDQRRSSGFQGLVVGEGALDAEGFHRLKFRFRGPDVYQKALSIYAERDEYQAEYTAGPFFVGLGDRYYTLSKLTQFSAYGRGLETSWRLSDRWQIGAYGQKNRWFNTKNVSSSGYIRYQVPGLMLQAHLVDIERPKRGGTLVGFLGKKEWNHLSLNLEVASQTDASRSSVDAEVAWKDSRVSSYIRWIHADPRFAGYFTDTDFLTGAFSLALSRRAGIRFHYRYEKQNIELDTMRYDAPLSRYFEGGLYYHLFGAMQSSVDFIRQSRKDRMRSLFDYSESSFRLRLNTPIGPKATLVASAEFGETENVLFARKAEMTRYTASVQYNPTHWQSYRGFVHWDESIRYSGEKRRMVTAGFHMKTDLGQRFQIQLGFQNNYSPESYYEDRNQTELLLKYTLPNHHSLQVRGRHTLLRYSDRSDRAVVAEYQAPFGIPVARKENACIVRGTIVDGQTGRPLPDLIVRMNGSTAVTDASGRFIFRTLQKREYYLTLDKASMGLNRVTLQKTPMPITPIPGKEGITLELAVVDGAMLTGRVLIQAQQNGGSPEEGGVIYGNGGPAPSESSACEEGERGVPRIVVEMRRDDEVLRRMTDENGAFRFEELRPGRWTLQFYPQNLPDYHRFEQDRFDVELRPGEKKTLNACVVPQRRRIRFLQEGGPVLHEKFMAR